MLCYFWLMIFLWVNLSVKMKHYNTMMKQICFIVEKRNCVEFYTVLVCSCLWHSEMLCRFLPELVWNILQNSRIFVLDLVRSGSTLESLAGPESSILAILLNWKMSCISWKIKGIFKATLDYYCRVDNWPMSLAPTNGGSGDLCKKNLSEKGKRWGLCKRKCLWREELLHL